jgi:hypothetical protein
VCLFPFDNNNVHTAISKNNNDNDNNHNHVQPNKRTNRASKQASNQPTNQPTKQPTMVVTMITPGQVHYCNSEQEYYEYLQKAGDKLIVVDCFAEWYDQNVSFASTRPPTTNSFHTIPVLKMHMYLIFGACLSVCWFAGLLACLLVGVTVGSCWVILPLWERQMEDSDYHCLCVCLCLCVCVCLCVRIFSCWYRDIQMFLSICAVVVVVVVVVSPYGPLLK